MHTDTTRYCTMVMPPHTLEARHHSDEYRTDYAHPRHSDYNGVSKFFRCCFTISGSVMLWQ